MPVQRMRMRPWLEQMIQSNSISGLVWLDEEEKIFSIPWRHGAGHGWEVDKDACLFKQWAIHTGKYTEGQTTTDPRTWKANFRCAIRSLTDVKEVNDKYISKGQTAVRVYRMLKVTTTPKGKRSRTTNGKRRSKSSKAEVMDYSDAQCPADQHTRQHEDTASIQHEDTPSIQHEDTSSIQHEDTPSIQHEDTPSIQHEDTPSIQHEDTPSIQHEDTPSIQQNTADSTGDQEATYVTPSEVPDWSTSVEIGPNSTNVLYRTFQISPEHSPEYGEPADDDIIQIAQQLEIDTPWTTHSLPGSADSRGRQSSETSAESSSSSSSSSPSSPGSQWSDASSADEMDPKLYTELFSGLLTTVEDLLFNSYSDNLNSSHNTFTQQITCPL